jgi:hypothetical protein
MAILHVQDAALGSASAATSQQTGAFAANPTVGNYLVAWGWGWMGSAHDLTPSFSDTAGGNTWVVPANGYQQIALDLWGFLGYAKVAATGASFKISSTGARTATGGSIMVCAAEFSGVASTSPLDGSAVGTTNTTGIPAPGNLTLTSGSLVLGLMTSDQTTYTTFGYSTPTGFTRAGMQNDGSTFQVGEAIWAINPTSPSNPSWATGTVKWAAAQFALLAAAGGASTAVGGEPVQLGNTTALSRPVAAGWLRTAMEGPRDASRLAGPPRPRRRLLRGLRRLAPGV